MLLTKGKMIKKLEEKGIRRNDTGKKLSHCKTYEVVKLYAKYFDF